MSERVWSLLVPSFSQHVCSPRRPRPLTHSFISTLPCFELAVITSYAAAVLHFDILRERSAGGETKAEEGGEGGAAGAAAALLR